MTFSTLKPTKRPWLLLLAALLLAPAPHAAGQNGKEPLIVSGTVLDAENRPVVGAAVFTKDAAQGVSTGTDGTFSLHVPADAVIVVRYIGYRTQEFAARSLHHARIVLVEDATQLGDVVVVGYGARKKESLTGAISNINSRELLTTTQTCRARSRACRSARTAASRAISIR